MVWAEGSGGEGMPSQSRRKRSSDWIWATRSFIHAGRDVEMARELMRVENVRMRRETEGSGCLLWGVNGLKSYCNSQSLWLKKKV